MINNDYLKQISDFQATFFRPVARYNEIAARLTEELASNSIRALNKVMSDYQDGFKAYSEVKKWEDFLAVQTALTDKTTNDLLEATQKCSQIMVEAMSDIGKLMQENYEKASAPIKQAQAVYSNTSKKERDSK